MVIMNINKYMSNEIKSLQNEDNTIRWIIEEEPNWDKVNLLKEHLIDNETRIVLVFFGNNNEVDYSQYECIKNNIIGVELYNRVSKLKSISGISMFAHLEEIVINDLYVKNIDLSELNQIDTLKEMCLLYENLTKEQHYTIGNLKNLKSLTVKGLDVELLPVLENVHYLTCYNLRNSKNLDKIFPNLRSLIIYKSSKDVDLDFVVNLKLLETLGIYGVSHICEIPNLNHLDKLRILSIENMKRLEKFPMLNRHMTSIELSGNLSSLDVKELASLTPENLPDIESILINLGKVSETDFVLNRFEGICRVLRS